MTRPSDAIVRFHQIAGRGRAPVRADRSAMGTLPMRAVRYCEALTSATAFGWWLFPPIGIEMLWDGSEIFWRCDDAPDWMPLLPAAQLPDYAATFDAVAPEALKGCSPPFLTALPEPGTVQLWTGLIARTAPGWHLLVRSPANLPQAGGICLFGGLSKPIGGLGRFSPICGSPAVICRSACAKITRLCRSSHYHAMSMAMRHWTR